MNKVVDRFEFGKRRVSSLSNEVKKGSNLSFVESDSHNFNNKGILSSSRADGRNRPVKIKSSKERKLESGIVSAFLIEEYREKKLSEFRERKFLFNYQHDQAPSKSMSSCRLMKIFGLTPSIFLNERGYSFGGLATCNNPYCVFCSRKRSHLRTDRIRRSILGARDKGLSVYFLTLTMRRSSDIVSLIRRMKKAWKAVQNKLDKVVKKKLGGKYSTARSIDVTFQVEGWNADSPYNLHLHCILIIDLEKRYEEDGSIIVSLSDEELTEIIKNAWCNSTEESEHVGQCIESVKDSGKVSRYCAKMAGLALELTGSNITKSGRKKNTLSFPELMQAGMSGSDYAVHLYKDFLTGMKGMKTLSFSRNWNEYAIMEEEEEEEISSPVAYIPDLWWDLCKPHLDDIGSILWKSMYVESGEDLREFQFLMSFKSISDFKEEFGDSSPLGEFGNWLSTGLLGKHYEVLHLA